MMTDEARQNLHTQQVKLIQMLQGQGEAAEGFDENKIAAASQALVRKRAGGVKTAWPELASHLGARFFNSFTLFVNAHPGLQPEPVADGYRFTLWLRSRERLPADVIAAVRRHEAERTGVPRIWWQPDRRKIMIAWRWRGRAHSATLG
jgi:hypothetical protein